MTITTTTSRWEAVGNGSTTIFPYNNKIFADTDLRVYLDGAPQTLTTHYTVSGAGANGGGNVTFLTAPANGVAVLIVRDVPDTQPIAYPAAGAFPSVATEDGLDKRTIISQQQKALFQRSLRYLETDASVPSAELPTLNSLKGRFLKFDATTGAPTAVGTAPQTLGVQSRAEALLLDDTSGMGTLSVYHGGVICHYQKDASGTALTTADGQDWSPLAGMPAYFQHWGAVGDGVTDDTTAVRAAMIYGGHIVVAGTFLCQNTTASAALTRLEGLAGATIKRHPSAITGSFMLVTGAAFEVSGVTFLGNSAANSNACHLLTIQTTCLDYDICHCTFNDAVAVAGFGSGVAVIANVSTSVGTIENNTFTACDNYGLQVTSANRIIVRGNHAYSNGNTGIFLNNFDLTFAQKINNAIVEGNIVHNNTLNGIVIGNLLADNVQGTPSYGYTNREAFSTTVHGNHCYENGGYGIVIAGADVACTGNVTRGNATSSDAYAGIVILAEQFAVTGNIVCDNEGFGIDSGGARRGTIANNFIHNNGAGTSRPGLNVEANVQVNVTGNTLRENSNVTGGVQILVERYGAAGATLGFPFIQSGVSISGNYIYINGTRVGIKLDNNPDGVSVINNTFDCATPSTDRFNLIKVYAEFANIEGNTLVNNPQQLLTPDGSGNLVWPDAFDFAYTNSATTIASLKTQSMVDVGDGIAYVELTGGGSGYTSQPTVTFTGGGGSGATAEALISAAGEVTGVRMTAHGSGYTSAPTVGFTGGGGSGATATAVDGLSPINGRVIRLYTNAACTITRLGDPTIANPAGTDISMPAIGTIELLGLFGRWNLASKNF